MRFEAGEMLTEAREESRLFRHFGGSTPKPLPDGTAASQSTAIKSNKRSGRRMRLRWAALAAASASAFIAIYIQSEAPQDVPNARVAKEQLSQPGEFFVDLPPPGLLKPVPPEQAQELNAKRPFSGRVDSPAIPFRLAATEAVRQRAVTCLAQAVYYEAAGEGIDGGRAVAQVVINRVRHPAYPASICGVVYQGAERTTGCQFSFTCDGSLRRKPVPSLWIRSLAIAQEALAGRVHAPVGHATHFHADYVLPYWADSLDKKIQIVRHIFYRLRGSLGSIGTFSQTYSGNELEPPREGEQGETEQVLPTVEAETLEDELIADDSARTGSDQETRIAATTAPLLADVTRGTLIGGGGPAAAGPRKSEPAGDSCAQKGGSKQLQRITANDVRLGSKEHDC